MTSKRLYFVLCGLLVLLAGLGGASIYLGNKQLVAKSAQLTSLKIDTRTLDDQQRSLLQAKKDITTYTELESIVKAIVPQEKDQARTVREIVKLAADSGISIGSITFPSSNLGQAAPKTAAPAEGEQAAAAPKAPPTSQLKAVDGIPGLFQLEITIQSASSATVSYDQFITFLKKLEQNRRTAQVTNLNVQPSSRDRNQVSFSLAVNVYVKP